MRIKYLCILMLFVTNAVFAKQAFKTPKEALSYALNALMKGDIEKLLDVTEKKELKQTQQLLELMKDSVEKKTEILEHHKKLKSWSIESVDEQSIDNRQLTIITVKWMLQPEINPLVMTPQKSENQILYTDYMLEKFKNEWKIISRRSIN